MTPLDPTETWATFSLMMSYLLIPFSCASWTSGWQKVRSNQLRQEAAIMAMELIR